MQRMFNPLRFYSLVIFCGGILMALEVLSSRLLAPEFGNSVYVWGSIIGVFLAALSLGYTLGGRWADRYPSLSHLGATVVYAAAGQAVILLGGESVVSWLGDLTGGSPRGTLLAATLVFGPTTVLLGTVAPWAVRIAADDLGRLGSTAGRLYTLSTLGSLGGTLLATFLLIPYMALGQIFGLLLGTTALVGLFALGPGRTLHAILGWLLVVFGMAHLLMDLETGSSRYRRITPYQTLEVYEDISGNRYLSSDGTIQAGIEVETGWPAISYPELSAAGLLLQPDLKKVLILGLGGGNCSTILRHVQPEVVFDFVEIDPAVPDIAERFLQFDLGPQDSLHIQDARRFLDRTEERWDLIVADTYIGHSVPFHLATEEFFALVHQRLEQDGVLALNIAGGLSQEFPRALLRGVAASFENLYLFKATGLNNVMALATDSPKLRPEDLVNRAQELNIAPGSKISLEHIAAHQLMTIDFEIYQAERLTDERAPVERLLARDRELIPN